MANQYYTPSGNPPNQTRALSALIRAESALVQAGFDKLPNLNTMFSNGANYAVDSGTLNALSVSINPSVTGLADGAEIVVKVAVTTTGSATISVTGASFFGVKNILRFDGSPLQPGDLVQGAFAPLRFNGVNGAFQMVQTPSASSGGGLPTTGGTMTGAINEAKGVPIASASTIDLNAATGNLIHITGGVTINAIALASGAERTIVFDGAPVITYNATTLILPGLANIAAVAGDTMKVRGDGAGNARVVSYTKANGTPVVDTQYLHVRNQQASGAAAGDFTTVGITTRVLNTVMSNTIPGASLASNVITLPAGTYDVFCRAPSYNATSNKAWLVNITDSSVQMVGSVALSQPSTGSSTDSIIAGRFTITAQKTFRIDHAGQSAGSGGIDTSGSGQIAVYTEAIFKKVA